MAMTLPIVLPSTPPSGSSPSPDAVDQQPRTPVSPTMQTSNEQPQSQPQHPQQGAPLSQQQAGNAANATQMKRKPSRRANTAERRATHNAVERQRRETLNGRFLVRRLAYDFCNFSDNCHLFSFFFPFPSIWRYQNQNNK